MSDNITRIHCWAAFATQDCVEENPEVLLGRFYNRSDAMFATNGFRMRRVAEEKIVIYDSIPSYNMDHRRKIIEGALAKLDGEEREMLREHFASLATPR